MFYIIIFGALAVLLVVAGMTVRSRNQTQLQAEDRHSSAGSNGKRRERKAKRQQSRHDRRKRH